MQKIKPQATFRQIQKFTGLFNLENQEQRWISLTCRETSNLVKRLLRSKIILAIVAFSFFLATPIYAAEHNTPAFAALYDFNKMPINQLTDKIGMRFITSAQFTLIQWTLKQGAKLPPHSHLNEQVIRVDNGSLKVDSEGEVHTLSTGQIMIFPSYIGHGFTALNDTVMYEQQTPSRQDFLEPDFIQKLSKYLTQNQ